MFGHLHTLNISFCDRLTNLAGLEMVPILSVSNCSNVEKCCEALGENQEWMFYSMEIPEVNNLSILRKLTLVNCSNIKNLEPLSNLFEVNLINCKRISDVSALSHVSNISLHYCEEVTDISMLSSAKKLSVVGCPIVKSVESLLHHICDFWVDTGRYNSIWEYFEQSI